MSGVLPKRDANVFFLKSQKISSRKKNELKFDYVCNSEIKGH